MKIKNKFLEGLGYDASGTRLVFSRRQATSDEHGAPSATPARADEKQSSIDGGDDGRATPRGSWFLWQLATFLMVLVLTIANLDTILAYSAVVGVRMSEWAQGVRRDLEDAKAGRPLRPKDAVTQPAATAPPAIAATPASPEQKQTVPPSQRKSEPAPPVQESQSRREPVQVERQQTRSFAYAPPFDIVDLGSAVLVTADLPEVDQKDLQISVVGETLNVKGYRKANVGVGKKYFRQERGFGTFKRTLALPMGVDDSNVQFSFDGGVLRITVAKLHSEIEKP